MTGRMKETDVVVIGAGPGGYAAAFHAADAGLKTILVDRRERPGGVCLYVGCIPSKALLHVAKLLSDVKDARQFGIRFGDPEIDVGALREWKSKVVDKFTGGLSQLADLRGVEFVQGSATFEDSTTLRLEDNEVSRIKFKHAIVATGSRPLGIPGIDLDSDRVVNSTGALELEEIPGNLLVVGGGYIGLELGTVYASLGSKVTVVEMTDGLLPGVDRDLVRPLARRVENLFESIHLNTRVVALEEAKNGIDVTLEEKNGKTLLNFNKVLISIGRTPNSEGLGLENINVVIGERGFVQVDDQRRTSIDNIFAIGDVAGQPMLAHKATREGKVVAEVIAGQKTIFDNVAIPSVVFTDPEVAWCGLTESEARSQSREIKVSRFPWAASGRALTLGRGEGLTKAIFDPETTRLLGVGIVGSHAGELIAEGVLAIEMAAVAEDLASTIHAHPTLSETLGEAAEAFLGQATHIYRK